jgi:uncharacterized repeat protein (TIGR03803 family)
MIKKLTFILISLFFCSFRIYAQPQLWGTCGAGGQNGNGTLWTANLDGSNLHTVHNFAIGELQGPLGNLVYLNNGWIYGVSNSVAITGLSLIYKFNPTNNTYLSIHNFDNNSAMGTHPEGGMTAVPDGNLYGQVNNEGAFYGGVIYKVNPTTNAYTALYHFDSLGSTPNGGLTYINDKLYGTTFVGGANNNGVIFYWDINTSSYHKVFDFQAGNQDISNYRFIVGNDGKLYNTSYRDGSYGCIYSFDIATNTYTNLHSFVTATGYGYTGGLIQASNGKLYGVTKYGGPGSLPGKGVLFSYDIPTNTYTVLYQFNTTSGYNPNRSLMQASNGLLFGVTPTGGANNKGTFFSFDINTNTFTKLHDFTELSTGMIPNCDIIEFDITPTNILSLMHPSDLIISPIPAEDFLTIRNSKESQQIRFFDVLGKEIAEVIINANSETNIDISQFPNVFFVRTGNGEVKKILKN